MYLPFDTNQNLLERDPAVSPEGEELMLALSFFLVFWEVRTGLGLHIRSLNETRAG